MKFLRVLIFAIFQVIRKNKACFKRRATAVLSWLNFSTTLTRL